MWRSDDEICADLTSGDPGRIGIGLLELEARLGMPDQPTIPPPNVSTLLSAVDKGMPLETQLDLLRILNRPRSFNPPMAADARRHAIVELVLRSGEHRIALEASLAFKGADEPAAVVADVVAEIGRHMLTSARAREGASRLLSYLLAGKPDVRSTTVNALADWPRDQDHIKVIEFVRPELDMMERARIGVE